MPSLVAGRWIAAVGVLVSMGVASVVDAADEGRVLLLPVYGRPAPAAAEGRRAEQAVADVLVALGFQVAGSAGSAGVGQPCDGGACAIEAARVAGANYVAVVRLTSARQAHSAEVAILAIGDGAAREVAREKLECGASDLCAPLPETAADAARAAGRRAVAEQDRKKSTDPVRADVTATPAAPGVPPSQAASVLGAAPPAIVTGASPPPAASERLGWRAWAPWALMGAGVGLVATSGVLFAVHHDGTDCNLKGGLCRNRYTTMPEAVVTGVLGVAAVGAGTFLWLRRDGAESSVAVGFGPQGVLATGTF